MKEENKNLKLFPKYRQISRDFLFFYTINVLFLTQVKHIDMSSVVLIDTFYSLFVVLVQIPASIIISKIGRKNSMILGNFCNALYLLLVINAKNFISLVFAELSCSIGFALKDIAEPAILNESIDVIKEEKSKIFAKIQSRAVSGYYLLSSISMILSGFLYEINGYIPIYISLFIVIISIIMSFNFDEPTKNYITKKENENEIKLTEAIKFCFKSKRCRCLLIYSGVFYAIICVLSTYEICLLEELKISSSYIGIIFAVLNIVSAIASRKQNLFQNKFKNKTLTILGIVLTTSIIFSGLIAISKLPIVLVITIIIIMYIAKYISVGLYNVLLIKYLSNFTNSKIDTKIFAINSFITSIMSVLFGIYASKLISIMNTANSMIIFGLTSLVTITVVLIYMKNKVGLNPKKYSKLELQYDMKK